MRVVLLGVIFHIFSLTVLAAGPREGFYLGFLAIEGRQEKIGICLEIERRDLKDRSQLIAFLKLKLGGFATHEYVSHFYIVDHFAWDAANLVLDGPSSGFGTDFTLWQGRVLDNGERITGLARSTRGGVVRGKVELVWMGYQVEFEKIDKLFPELPMVRSLTGQYEGRCDGKDRILQLEAMKVMDSRKDQFKTLAGFEINGRIAMNTFGQHTGFSFKAGDTFNGLAYNIYTGTIVAPMGDKNCKITKGFIDCGETCKMNRVVMPERPLDDLLVNYQCTVNERIHHFSEFDTAEPLHYPFVQDQLEGEYYGLLHLEERNVYKAVSFEIAMEGKPASSEPGAFQPTVSTIFRIYATTAAGLDLEKHQHIVIAFKPNDFPLGKFEPFWVESDADMLLKFTEWNSAGIKATLFSKNYGKAGTIELVRGRIPKQFHVDGLPKASPIEGTFYGKISRYPGDSVESIDFQVNMVPIQNPLAVSVSYFPFNLTGPVDIVTTGSVVKGYVASGVFDLFTGTIRLNLDAEQVIMGKLVKDGIRGFISSGYAHIPLRPHIWTDFKAH